MIDLDKLADLARKVPRKGSRFAKSDPVGLMKLEVYVCNQIRRAEEKVRAEVWQAQENARIELSDARRARPLWRRLVDAWRNVA